jgi:ferrous iron transport protein A
MNEKSLSDLKNGQIAKVKKLLSTGSMRRRLQDIGLIEGTEVECLQRSPGGDPIAYLIRGAVIALRSEDSSKVLVL